MQELTKRNRDGGICNRDHGCIEGEFLNLTVEMGEVYLSSVMEYINAYYTDKLSNLHTAFEVERYLDCLLCGDSSRLIEVLQNIMENALKYGDGKYITISFSTEEDCCLITVKTAAAH